MFVFLLNQIYDYPKIVLYTIYGHQHTMHTTRAGMLRQKAPSSAITLSNTFRHAHVCGVCTVHAQTLKTYLMDTVGVECIILTSLLCTRSPRETSVWSARLHHRGSRKIAQYNWCGKQRMFARTPLQKQTEFPCTHRLAHLINAQTHTHYTINISMVQYVFSSFFILISYKCACWLAVVLCCGWGYANDKSKGMFA